MPTGRVYVLDRRARKLQPRREASHRRQILPKTVEQEMTEAGYAIWFRGPRLAWDRFLLIFGKAQPGKALNEDWLPADISVKSASGYINIVYVNVRQYQKKLVHNISKMIFVYIRLF